MIRKGQTTHDLAKALLELPPKKFKKDDDDALVANFADDEDAPEDGGTDIIVREW